MYEFQFQKNVRFTNLLQVSFFIALAYDNSRTDLCIKHPMTHYNMDINLSCGISPQLVRIYRNIRNIIETLYFWPYDAEILN